MNNVTSTSIWSRHKAPILTGLALGAASLSAFALCAFQPVADTLGMSANVALTSLPIDAKLIGLFGVAITAISGTVSAMAHREARLAEKARHETTLPRLPRSDSDLSDSERQNEGWIY